MHECKSISDRDGDIAVLLDDPDRSEDLHPRRLQQSLHWRDKFKKDTEGQTGEHKQAVKGGDPKNGTAVFAHESHHAIDWDGAKVKHIVIGYWQRRMTEAIHIRTSMGTLEP